MSQAVHELTPNGLSRFLLTFAPVRPIFIWGSPGIGKSTLVEKFSNAVGMECVTLLGSQLAAEDLIGIPQIDGKVSRFFPPSMIVRDQPFCLFIDELNLASDEVRKSFYSLILEKRVGEYHLPKGSIIIGAGNRAQDSALVKQLPSALINRMIHVHLAVSHRDWMDWAKSAYIHDWVLQYLTARPYHLSVKMVPVREEPFTTPRAWEFISDGLFSLFGKKEDVDPADEDLLDALLFGCLTKEHALAFKAFIKQLRFRFSLPAILSKKEKWPQDAKNRDLLYFLVQSLRDKLIKELPEKNEGLRRESQELLMQAKDALKELSRIDNELAQMVLGETQDGNKLPAWFMIEIARELPRLLAEKEKQIGKN